MTLQTLEVSFGNPVISTHTLESVITGPVSHNNPSDAAWPAANRAIYVPFRISISIVATLLWLLNGTVVNGNFDIGIYDREGARIVHTGSTAQAGISAIQSVNIADTRIGPGMFYFALAFDNAVGRTSYCSMAGNLNKTQLVGLAQEANAFPLPANATFAAVTSAYTPIFGLAVYPRGVV